LSESVDELRAAGEKVAEGRFKIDSKRALERLRHNRLADPSHWVLDVLRAAHASGATLVNLDTDADDVEIRFDGKPFPASAMKDLLSQALGSDDGSEPRVRLLALGVAGALGLGLKHLTVASGGTAVDFDEAGQPALSRASETGTRVHAHKRLSLKVAAALVKGSPEEHAARERCARYGINLFINGKKLPQGDTPGTASTRGDLELSAAVLVLPTISTAEVLLHGVQVTRRQILLPGLQLAAVVSCPALQRNASGDDIVENDPAWLEALKQLETRSLDALKAAAKEPDEVLRRRIRWRLVHEPTLNDEARAVMEGCPLIPSPEGGFVAVAALKAAAAEGAPVYFAQREYPKGTCPPNTVLLTPATRATWAPLLPGKKREDVAAYVQRKLRSAENRARWEAQAPEVPVLDDRRAWLSKAPIDTPKLKGEVGLFSMEPGAFVRILGNGRFLQQGEVIQLAPLRLRAVVDYRGTLSEKTWAELPSPKLWSSVADGIEKAAERALERALEDHPLSLETASHARDLLVRAAQQGRTLDDLPKVLFSAALFPCVGGGLISLAELKNEKTWRYTSTPFDEGLLSGKQVMQLNDDDFKLLNPHADGRWKDVTEQLEREVGVRRRIRGGKQEPLVAGKLVSVAFDVDGVRGEVALAADDTQLNVDLYREGVLLEHARTAAQYGTAWAAVENPKLKPNEAWTAAVRNAAFNESIAAVRGVERSLAREVVKTWPTFAKMHVAARHYLLSFVQKEIRGADFAALDEYARPVVDAPIIDTPHGGTSLFELRGAASAAGRVWLLSPGLDASALAGQPVVIGGSEVQQLVEQAIGWKPEDGAPELLRARERERFKNLPQWPRHIDAAAPLRVQLSHGGLNVTAALDQGLGRSACVDVLNQKRKWMQLTVEAAMPLAIIAELDPPADPGFPPGLELQRTAAEAAGLAQAKVLERALDEPASPLARRAVMFALKNTADDTVLDELKQRLLNAPVFECHDGVWRAAAVFDVRKTVPFVTRRLEGDVRSDGPIVLALDEETAIGLARFRHRQDVTDLLQAEAEARVLRASLPQVDEVRFTHEKLASRRIRGKGIEGEVCVAPDSDGLLEVLTDKRPLCTVSGALPWPFAAAVDSDRLNPDASHRGIEHDADYDALLRNLQELCEGLAEELAKAWPELSGRPNAREAALRVCTWFHGRHKKERAVNPLADLPLLQSTDGRALTVEALLDEMKQRKEVLYAEQTGALIERDRFVLKADQRERERLGPLKLKLVDGTNLLLKAERLRARPRVETLAVPLGGKFREPVTGEGIEGEVLLSGAPTAELAVDLFRNRTLLERYASPHAAGAVARVNCDALIPNQGWTKAQRNPQFRAVMDAVERALERLVARRLLSEPHDAAWRAWALAAIRWETPDDGPLHHALPALELFTALDGRPISVGTVLDEFNRTRRVAVAMPNLEPGGALVLQSDEETWKLLEALKLTVKEVSDELRRKGELDADRRARRIAALRWPGNALVRLEVQVDGVHGELAVPATGEVVEVTLAKQGVRIEALPRDLAHRVAGVLDVDALEVDETWTKAKLSVELKELVAHHVEQLMLKLARSAADLSADGRATARDVVLQWLKHAGVQAPLHLERLSGAPAALARAAVFETIDGEWVSAVAVADEVRRRGRVAVFKRSLFTPDTLGALGLKAHALDEEWLDALEGVLGRSSVERVKDVSEWREELREEDPPKGSAELRGLERLRRDVRLLRAGALGELSPEDVGDVRLKALGGKSAPVQYDVKRRVALLDADHPHVKRALAESSARRERLYVLLAAMYGAVNRALERITDQHEEELAGSLAAHLASNPQLLDPKKDS
jgi:hypothetical protein